MARRSSRKTPDPKPGKLEADVDAVLRAQGLAINQTVEKLLDKSARRVRFGGRRPPKPARAKRLREPGNHLAGVAKPGQRHGT